MSALFVSPRIFLLSTSSMLTAALLLSNACDDGASKDEDASSEVGTAEASSAGASASDQGQSESANGSASTTSGGGDNGTGTTGGDGCVSELRRYDLKGSTIFIDSLVDFKITVQEPYDEPLNTGPGHVVLRLSEAGGLSFVQLLEFSLMQDFLTGATGLAEVKTEVLSTQPYAECGGPTGSIVGTDLGWANPQLAPYCRDGNVSCTGSICGSVGSPPEGEPFVFVNECETAVKLNSFVFNADRSAFTMEAAMLSMGTGETTTLTLSGNLVSAEPDAAAPACACAG